MDIFLLFLLLIVFIFSICLLALPNRTNYNVKERMSPKRITIGDPLWYMKNGKYYSCKTHKEVFVESKSLNEWLEKYKNDTKQ